MELRSDVTGTRPVTQAANIPQVSPAGDLRQDVYSRLMMLAVGRPLPAEVMSQTESGTSMVRVADTVVQMDLPEGAQVGDKVTLTLLAKEPRLTFLFDRAPAAHSSVSNTGRLIDNILRSLSQEGSTPTLSGRAPLLQAPATSETGAPVPMPQMAAALQTALAKVFDTSGLFYESHLAQWVAGDRPRADLMAEPQAKMANPHQAAAREGEQMNRLEVLQEKSWVQSLLSKVSTKVQALTGQEQQAQKTEPVVDRDAANMIRMQLDTLEQPASWQSVLRVNLPSLGAVTATMRLSGGAVQVQLTAADGDTMSLLREFGPQLSGALEQAGARMDYFTVNDEKV